MRALRALYCTPLAAAERAAIVRRVAARRAGEVHRLVEQALRPGGLAGLGDTAPRLVAALAELLALSAAEPERFRRIVDHWSTAFLLRQVVTGPAGEVDRDRALAALVSRALAARAAADGGADRLEPWGVELAEGAALGLCPAGQPSDGTEEPPLPLRRSMAEAYELLDDLWPEVPAWASVIIPAYVDMGAPPHRDVHTSGSIGPGHPVSVTRVYEPFLHAEDVVHELQHGRLYLLDPHDTFPSWADDATRFVSPYRPDPRPLRGLLLGMHAFLAVNRFRLLAMAAGRFQADVRALLNSHRANLFVFRTVLEHERVPESGRDLLGEMARAIVAQHEAIEALAAPSLGRSFDEAFAVHVAAVAARSERPLVNLAPGHRDWEETVRRAALVGEVAQEREETHAP